MVVYLFLLIISSQAMNVSLSQENASKNAFELQLQDKFAHMLGTKLSLGEPVDKRYSYLKMRIALLTIGDHEIKKLVHQVDLFKELIGMIHTTYPQKKLPDDILHFLHDVPGIAIQTQEQLQHQVTRFKNFLSIFLQKLHHDNLLVHNQNNELRKSLAALEEKYNVSYMKNLFDLVYDKKTMQFFGAVIGLIVFMNAASWWNLNPAEHMIVTSLGLCGFFSFVLRLYPL